MRREQGLPVGTSGILRKPYLQEAETEGGENGRQPRRPHSARATSCTWGSEPAGQAARALFRGNSQAGFCRGSRRRPAQIKFALARSFREDVTLGRGIGGAIPAGEIEKVLPLEDPGPVRLAVLTSIPSPAETQ